ncbi:chloride channel protein [candidate division KSB1 bacterium]|nr:chloride channel protein [candidate division KSB1 bacterium]
MKLKRFLLSAPFKGAGPLSKLLGLAGLVGLVAGLGAILFYWLLNASQYFFMDFLMGYRPMGPAGESSLLGETDTVFKPYLFLVIPALGGLLSGLIVFWLAPEAEGHGTDAAIDTFHRKQGLIRGRVPFVKIISSALTIGSGGSGGREGPIAQIGAGFGSLLGQWLGLSPTDRRILMVSGMGAGIGAIFHAPLAGALFASEVLYRETEFEYEVLVPTAIASSIAYGVFNTQFGWNSLFETPAFRFTNPLELIPYTVLAIIVAFAAKLFIKLFYFIRDWFAKLPGPPHLKPMYGGMLVGIIAFFLPEEIRLGAVGTGYGIIQQGLDIPDGPMTLQILLFIAVAKMFTTSFSIGSGGSGGVFGPSVVIGGALGGAVGWAFLLYFDQFHVAPGAFVIVGMAGFFSAAAKTPISMVIMVSEMTGNYLLLVPAMWVNAIAFFVNRKTTLYEKQIPTRLDSPAHLGNFMEEILRQLKVKDAINRNPETPLPIVRQNTTLMELLDLLATSVSQVFPVLNEDDELIGMIDARDVRITYREKQLAPLLVAQDFLQEPITITNRDSLFTAVRKQHEIDIRDLIVVDADNSKKVLAVLNGNDIISVYDREIKKSMRDIRSDIKKIGH